MKSVLFLAPLVFVNVWHGMVIALARVMNGSFASISESALLRGMTLWTHRLIHVIGAVCFMAFAAVSFRSIGFCSVVLFVAAVFDIAQAVYLSEKTDHSPMNLRDTHQLFAWMMAAGYLLFCVFYAVSAQVHAGLVAVYITMLALIAGGNKLSHFKHFWAAQMLFFVLTSLLMAYSYRFFA